MNGAEALIEGLSDGGVEVCFANPGTSEMQIVSAIDKHPTMRAILGLFEGVVTGAADGYGRMADKPAATLLHLGPGLANGCANLHNARRARSPVVNIVGDHAVAHLAYDAPLTSDVVGVARPMSDWVAVSKSATDLAVQGVNAVAASLVYPGQVATLIVPADHAWGEGAHPALPGAKPVAPRIQESTVAAVAEALKGGERSALFLGGRALRADALEVAGRIAASTGARLICETFPARLQRGIGRVAIERLPYFAEVACASLLDLDTIILIGAPAPVAFFAYPDKPSWLSPPGAALITLATPLENSFDALTRLAEALDAPHEPCGRQERVTAEVAGNLTPRSVGAILAQQMPENAIISDEAATGSVPIYEMLAGAPAHDWLTLTGGAIGQGLPLAVGAAVACPDRKVIALQADGSGMYTLQALWTMARENLNVTVIILNNASYAILNYELQRVGVTAPGPKARSLLDLTQPALDWVALSEGMGVPAMRTKTVGEFRTALAAALSHCGPQLVEVSMIRPSN